MSALRPPDPGAVGAAFDALAKADEADAARRRTYDEKQAAAAALEEKFFGVLEDAMLEFLEAAHDRHNEDAYLKAERHYYRTGQRIAARFMFADLATAGNAISKQVENIISRERIARYGLKEGA